MNWVVTSDLIVRCAFIFAGIVVFKKGIFNLVLKRYKVELFFFIECAFIINVGLSVEDRIIVVLFLLPLVLFLLLPTFLSLGVLCLRRLDALLILNRAFITHVEIFKRLRRVEI